MKFSYEFEAESALRHAYLRDPDAEQVTVKTEYLRWALKTLVDQVLEIEELKGKLRDTA